MSNRPLTTWEQRSKSQIYNDIGALYGTMIGALDCGDTETAKEARDQILRAARAIHRREIGALDRELEMELLTRTRSRIARESRSIEQFTDAARITRYPDLELPDYHRLILGPWPGQVT